jgi:hypothetical protein
LISFLITGTALGQTGSDFTFVRLSWTPRSDLPYDVRDIHIWNGDFPDADNCLMQSLKATTLIKNPATKVLSPDSKELFNYPFAYLTEAGWPDFSETEVTNLRNWLGKGGFLFADDFHGPMATFEGSGGRFADERGNIIPNEWRQWVQQLKKIFPNLIETNKIYSQSTLRNYEGEYVILRLTKDHPVFNIFFRFEEIPHIQGLRAQNIFKSDFEEGGKEHYIMGLFDPKGRLAVLMNYNMDTGDGWEYCKEAWITQYGSTQVPMGLKLGINYIIYSLTH